MKKIVKILITFFVFLTACLPAFAASPTDEEVIAAYKSANKVYSWFSLAPLPTNGRIKKEAGYMIYYNVNYPNIRTISDLRHAMNAVFTSDLTSKILASSRTYKEFNGGLYVAPCDLKPNAFAGESSFKVQRLTDDNINLQITTEILENPKENKMNVVRYETKNFSYVNTLIGWRFATFERIK